MPRACTTDRSEIGKLGCFQIRESARKQRSVDARMLCVKGLEP